MLADSTSEPGKIGKMEVSTALMPKLSLKGGLGGARVRGEVCFGFLLEGRRRTEVTDGPVENPWRI